MNYVTRIITEEEKAMLMSFYSDKVLDTKGDYLVFAAQGENAKVFIYESKKGFKVSFQGEDPLKEANLFFLDATLSLPKKKVKTCFLDYSPQIGSDEVGTGDVFGPLVVTACYFDEKIFKNNPTLQIADSKKLNDKTIISIVEKILPTLIYSKFTLSNEKYNALIQKGYNMNELKAILHNKALKSLAKKTNYNHAYIDQFCKEEYYYHYLIKAKQIPLKQNIIFLTKGESYYPSIALASMISRYSFLKDLQKMEEEYKFTFPKGASKKVDEALIEFINKYGKDELCKVAKLNFKNIKNLK